MAKPVFCATHPRACSTAFERVFMTRKDLSCVHEPFGDAFYYGPERLSVRYENDEEARTTSGYSESTYKTIFDHLDREASEGKRVFIKDILHYLVPPNEQLAKLAPSLQLVKRGIGTGEAANTINGTNGVNSVNGTKHANGTNGTNGASHNGPFPFPTEGEPGNPTVVPRALLEKFHFTFLIRDPHSSIPSYYRCTVPPLDDVTGWYDFYPSEAGYDELRRFFDYARESGLVQKGYSGRANGPTNGNISNGDANVPGLCLVDADDLLDDPEGILQAYCRTVGLEFHSNMLKWDNEEDQERAKEAFEKWKGFHEDAIDSTDLKPRSHKKASKTEAQWDAEWKEKYGEKAAKVIRETVDQNMADFLYLKQFAVKA